MGSPPRQNVFRRTLAALFQPGWLTVFLLVCLLVYILRLYYLKPYSDPLNWLTLAGNLRPDNHLQRFPLAYPLFLRAVRPLLGPLYIFLANLPLLLLMIVLSARLAVSAARPMLEPRLAALAGAATIAGLLAFDPGLLVYLTNPYRDPLSHALLLGALLLLIAYVERGGRPVGALLGSGLALGLATSVRETAILMAPVMAWYGIVNARRNRTIPLARSMILFAVFLGLGALPLALQSWLRTGQALLPPQAAVEGRLLPGLHLQAFAATFGRALHYAWTRGGPLFAAGLLAAIGAAFVRRASVLRDLLLPAALVNFVFYGFYWTFVRRYIYIAVLLAMPAAACGGLVLLAGLLRRARREAWREPVLRGVTTLAGLASGAALFLAPAARQFQVPQARALRADLERLVPDHGVVFAPPRACDIIAYLTGRVSYPPSYDDPRRTAEQIARQVEPLLEHGTPVFLLDNPKDPIGLIFRRLFHAEPRATLDADRYHLRSTVGLRELQLSRLSAWSNRTAAVVLEPPPRPGDVVQVDGQSLWLGIRPREYARLSLNGRVIADRLGNGASYFRLPWEAWTPPYRLELESDQPVPDVLRVAVLRPDEPLVYSFRDCADPAHDSMLGEGFHFLQGPSRYGAHWTGSATLALPADLWSPHDVVSAGFMLRARPTSPENYLSEICLRFSAEGRPVAEVLLPRDTEHRRRWTLLPPDARTGGVCRLTLTVDGAARADDGSPLQVELDSVVLHNLSAMRAIVVGHRLDYPFILDGFHGRESHGGEPMRWTDGRGRLQVWLRESPEDQAVRVRFEPGVRAPEAPPPDLALFFNDVKLAGRETASNLYEAAIDAALIREGANELVVASSTWSPSQLLASPDRRRLGLAVKEVSFYSPTP